MWLKQVTELTESRLLEDDLTSFCTCGWAERDERHQSRRCFREPTRERLERRMSNFESLHLWQMYISGTLDLRILAHERWIQVLHWLHSIIALPANGFMQKHVTRSQESSSESTMMSSSSPDPSSSLNTTCFPWRTTTLLPEKPSTFKTTASSSGFKGFSTSSDFGLELLEPFQQGRPTKGSCLHVPVAGELKAGFELVPVRIGWSLPMPSVGTGMLK